MVKFLTLKHWQIFSLLFGLPVIFQFVFMGLLLTGGHPAVMFMASPLLMILFMAPFFGWFYSLGVNLYKKLPLKSTMSLTKFKIFTYVPVVYVFCLTLWMLSSFTSDAQPGPAFFVLIVPMHFFSMFCMFYCLYFNAKALKTAERQKAVTFSDYAGEFFLLWFFPVGVWIIQPRINRLFQNAARHPF